MIEKPTIINKIEQIAQSQDITSVVAKYTLNNLHLINKLNEEEFINHSFINQQILTSFLSLLKINNYQEFVKNISLCINQNQTNNHLSQNFDNLLIQKFYSQLLNSLEVTYVILNQQQNIISNVVEKFKNAHQIYIITQKKSLKIIEEFSQKLIFAGFNIKIISNFYEINSFISKFNHRTLVLVVFDEYQNKPLVEISKKIEENKIKTLIICRKNFNDLDKLSGLKLIIDYWNFPRHSMLDVRGYTLLFVFNLIYAKISQIIISNYNNVAEQFVKKD